MLIPNFIRYCSDWWAGTHLYIYICVIIQLFNHSSFLTLKNVQLTFWSQKQQSCQQPTYIVSWLGGLCNLNCNYPKCRRWKWSNGYAVDTRLRLGIKCVCVCVCVCVYVSMCLHCTWRTLDCRWFVRANLSRVTINRIALAAYNECKELAGCLPLRTLMDSTPQSIFE